jgi:type I restriction enzyme S subunit
MEVLMELETFFEQFELLADAPNGVQKLRELILQLAVQGKLVPQDPNDEPAEVLLERIEAEKKRLVQEGKIRNSKPFPSIEADEIPFELPDGWQWVYLEKISNEIHYGYTASANHELTDIRLLRITDIQNNRVNWGTVPGCQIEASKLPVYELNDGNLLIARTGGTIGKSYLVEDLSVRAVFASYLIRIIPTAPFSPKYLKLFLESELYWNQLYAKSMGTGQPNVNATSLKALIVPIPPLPEQNRIVAKVARLMSLCDELEARQEKRHDRILQLGEVATSQLLTPSTPEAFNQHWQGICDNFDLLYSTPENVSQLRQAILQLAVMGKLVPQDPNEEPASVLLERIEVEKARLVKEGKIEKSQKLPPMEADGMSYELQDGWKWVRLGQLLTLLRNGVSTPPNANNGTPILRISSLRPNCVNIQDVRFLPEPISRYQDYQLIPGDLLFTRYSGNKNFVGICGVVPAHDEPLVYPDKLIRGCLSTDYLQPKYVALAVNTGESRFFIDRCLKTTAGQVGISGKNLKETPIPLPPINEQKRIVAKVDQLMSLCDELEAKLTQSINNREKLMETAVSQVLVA